MSNLAKVPAEEIETVLAQHNAVAIRDYPPMQQALALASGIGHLKRLITKEVVEALLLPLQNSTLGFLTDNKDGYDGPTVRECAIEAMLRGLRPVGNEFNIISGRMYAARAGLERLVGEFPGLTNLELIPGVPTMAGGGALVPFRATWLLNGVRQTMVLDVDAEAKTDTRIPVKVNSGMGADAIIGKATRKMCARILQRLTGSTWTDGEVGEAMPLALPESAPTITAPGEQGRRMKLGAKPIETTAREPGEEG